MLRLSMKLNEVYFGTFTAEIYFELWPKIVTLALSLGTQI